MTVLGKLEGVEDYVEDLIQHLKDEVPESAFPRALWATTPFMWFATAGMRLLPSKEAADLTNKLRQVGYIRGEGALSRSFMISKYSFLGFPVAFITCER